MALKKQLAGGAALATAIGFGLCAPPAQAAYTITVQQVGSVVVATGSGSIDFDALAVYGDELDTSLIAASDGAIIVGPTTSTDDTYYSGVTGPITFGAGGEFFADTGSGGIVGLGTFDEASGGVVAVPQDYVSGAALGTSTATFTNATISGLGLRPGAYVWTWGDGATADSLTLDISSLGAAAPAPEPATWAMMVLGLAGLALLRTRRTIPVSA